MIIFQNKVKKNKRLKNAALEDNLGKNCFKLLNQFHLTLEHANLNKNLCFSDDYSVL